MGSDLQDLRQISGEISLDEEIQLSLARLVRSPFHGRPRIFRDPIHGDIEWPKDDFGTLVSRLIDTPAFQRLRHVRQNGVTNLVFHGAEHSRFAHSVGVAWTAAKMLAAIERNSQSPLDEQTQQDTILAALLHDLGHGPFSHTLEEILGRQNFDHEDMTVRFLTEPKSEIAVLLDGSSSGRSERLAQFIDKRRRTQSLWCHSVVSSQLDADRLDYIQRDARMAGIDNHRPDIQRLIAHLSRHEDKIVVDHRAFDVIESMLLALDHLYGAVYFHRTVRAATTLLGAVMARATAIAEQVLAKDDPLFSLLRDKGDIALADYVRVNDATVWYHLDRWSRSDDEELRFYADRLRRRRLPKPLAMPEGFDKTKKLIEKAHERVKATFPKFDANRLVTTDEPSRLNYKRYDADSGGSILTWERNAKEPRRIEDIEEQRSILPKVARKFYRSRIYVPDEVHDELREFAIKENLVPR